jgi:hypothetical protein
MADFPGIMSGLLINPVFISRFYSAYGGADGSTEAVNQTIIGISVSCLQISAAIGALVALLASTHSLLVAPYKALASGSSP